MEPLELNQTDLIFNKIQRDFADLHEDLLKKVLFQVLKREPSKEDAKRCTIYKYPNESLDYELAFDGVLLGKVYFDMHGPSWKITFKPAREWT